MSQVQFSACYSGAASDAKGASTAKQRLRISVPTEREGEGFARLRQGVRSSRPPAIAAARAPFIPGTQGRLRKGRGRSARRPDRLGCPVFARACRVASGLIKPLALALVTAPERDQTNRGIVRTVLQLPAPRRPAVHATMSPLQA